MIGFYYSIILSKSNKYLINSPYLNNIKTESANKIFFVIKQNISIIIASITSCIIYTLTYRTIIIFIPFSIV